MIDILGYLIILIVGIVAGYIVARGRRSRECSRCMSSDWPGDLE